MKRECGVLLAISSLPSSYGIGDFGKEAYRFVDFLVSSGQSLWQILPLCPVEYGNSPYQSPSTFAGNFLYLDLENLVNNEYLTQKDIDILKQEVSYIDYEYIKSQKESLLRKASQAFFYKKKEQEEFENFQKENQFWLEDYALFLALNKKFKGRMWNTWQKEYKFRDKKIIEDISVRLYENELVCILGLSGVGKTTLFNVIAGLISPSEGTVEMNGSDITGKSGNISYMLQKDLLLPFKTVIDNVSLPLVIKGEKKKFAREKAEKYFMQFGLEGTEKKYPNQLSGGMRQRAALLRTYLFSNETALLDEPFSALDAITKHRMHLWYLDIMKQIKMSTLFITHDIDEAIILSDRIYILSGSPGKITAEIEVDIDRGGDNEELQLSEKFLKYKREILEYLK